MDIQQQHLSTIRKRIETQALIPVEPALIEAYLDILRIEKVKKRQYIVQPGFPCREQVYVVQGTFRAFVIDPEGKEQTFQFAIEGWYISDVRSYLSGEPATMYVEALEDSIVAYIPKKAFEELGDRYPKWQKMSYLTVLGGFAYAQKRMIANLQKSAEERYLEFIREYSEIEQRVPRHMLASYLNMSQEYLSKIRKKLMESEA